MNNYVPFIWIMEGKCEDSLHQIVGCEESPIGSILILSFMWMETRRMGDYRKSNL